jgi:hypothetical protein
MNKKLTSTLLLFAIFLGFLIWGLSMLSDSLTTTPRNYEAIIYSLLILGCSFAALIAILKLPYKRQS